MGTYEEEVFRPSVFSDETENFRYPAQPDAGELVSVRLRFVKDSGAEGYLVRAGERTRLLPDFSDGLLDYRKGSFILGKEPVEYWFEIELKGRLYYYDRLGLSEEKSRAPFRIFPGAKVPDWAQGAAMYQIFVDRFRNGDPSNDVVSGEYCYVDQMPVEQVKDWKTYPSYLDVGCFYGGDLEGVRQKLDYLSYLGVECIYFNPLFVSPSNHKYDSQDYDHIDPHFGTIVHDSPVILPEGDWDNSHEEKYRVRTTDPENLRKSDQLFARLAEEIHSRGMKLILDGVFNHCGSFHKWMDREKLYQNTGEGPGAYISENSPYRPYFRFFSERWPDNDDYEGWWGYDTLPKLNYENSTELCERIFQVAQKWVSPPYCADGWRLDVAADLGHSPAFNHWFWKEFRKRVKKANPNAFILAEHYGDPSPWLNGDEWDSVMNYDGFMEPVSYFFTGMEKHSDAFRPELLGNGRAFFDSMKRAMAKLPRGALYTAMNELSNHDHSRFLTRTNGRTGRTEIAGPKGAEENVSIPMLRLAAMLQFTWPGCPTVYYGDETGVCGWTDPDSRRTYPWGEENWELIEYHRYLFEMRRQNPGLKLGSVKELGACQGMISYGRFWKDSCLVIVLNQGAERWHGRIPVWELGIGDGAEMERIMFTGTSGYNAGKISILCTGGYMELDMPPCSGGVFRLKEN